MRSAKAAGAPSRDQPSSTISLTPGSIVNSRHRTAAGRATRRAPAAEPRIPLSSASLCPYSAFWIWASGSPFACSALIATNCRA